MLPGKSISRHHIRGKKNRLDILSNRHAQILKKLHFSSFFEHIMSLSEFLFFIIAVFLFRLRDRSKMIFFIVH